MHAMASANSSINTISNGSYQTNLRPSPSVLENFDPIMIRSTLRSPQQEEDFSEDFLEETDENGYLQLTPETIEVQSPKEENVSNSSITKKRPSKVRSLINISTDLIVGRTRKTSSPNTSSSSAVTSPIVKNDSFPRLNNSSHTGMLRWIASSSKKDPHNLWTELKNGVLISYSVPHKSETRKDVIPLDQLLTIGIFGTEKSFSFDLILNMSNKEKSSRMTLTATTDQERTSWMKWILEQSTQLNHDSVDTFTRCGQVFIKDGVTADWQKAWIVIQAEDKKLWIHRSGTTFCEDLRKVRSASHLAVCDKKGCPTLQPGCPFVINWASHTRYIQCDQRAETESWFEFIRSVALKSGEDLDDHQLTADDVPVLVECCIKFVETYGILSEGIYRRSGAQSKCNHLLAGLQFDAWKFHISREEYTEHDVANVLKRFFRNLPEPLLTNERYHHWIEGLSVQDRDSQIKSFKDLIASLPYIRRQTLCKLLGHLYVMQNKSDKNLMPTRNLASFWGPTIMTVSDPTSNYSRSAEEIEVAVKLIEYYPWLFDIDLEKLSVIKGITEVQEKLMKQHSLAVKETAPGDIISWILCEPLNKDISVEIGPKVKVGDVLIDFQTNAKDYTGILIESICRGELRRPLNSQEVLLPTILKWTDWNEDDRRDNKLIFGHHPVIDKLSIYSKNLVPKSMFEGHYSGPSSKSFLQCSIQFSQARFSILKDSKPVKDLFWDLDHVTWYLGGNLRRCPPTQWCITFIEKNEAQIRKKENPLFLGHCLSFSSEQDYLTLLASLMLAEFEGLAWLVSRLWRPRTQAGDIISSDF